MAILALALAVGLCLGSFLNVCIYRLQRGGSLWRPGSRCPKCRKPIAPYDNVPVVSYFLLRGRCRRCRARISPRYPAIELLTGLVTVGLTRRWLGSWGWLAAAEAAACALVTLSFIDFDTLYIPDALSLGLIPLGLAASYVNPWFAGSPIDRVLTSIAGAALGLALTWALAWGGEKVFKKEALGGGDIKLLAGVGALLGWQGAIGALMIGSFVGAAYGLTLMALGKVGRGDAIPFGPFLSLGALVNLFVRLGPLELMIKP